jgi:hypothetical protein
VIAINERTGGATAITRINELIEEPAPAVPAAGESPSGSEVAGAAVAS